MTFLRNTIHVLLLEDEESQAFLLQELMEEYQGTVMLVCHWRKSLIEAQEALLRKDYDLIVLNPRMGDSMKLEAFDEVQSWAARDQCPIIVLSSVDDEEHCISALEAGAQDYVVANQLTSPILARIVFAAIIRQRKTVALSRQNNDLDSFIWAASHNLRSPLSNISNLTVFLKDLLARTDTDEEVEYILKLMSESTARAEALVVDLLNFFRTSRQKIERQQTGLKEICEQALQLNQSLVEETQASIELKTHSKVSFDLNLMAIAVAALIENACLYAGDSPPEIVITEQTTEAGELILSIQDQGIGVPRKCREMIFLHLRRAVHDSDYPGVGLGLSLASSIVSAHDGELQLASEIENGSRFDLIFPKRSY